ncbi:class I SAM-dependent methyltransferase [Chryseobacterium sp.]|uniref:class I SAM-dependent methyltransferase n=1 Tax=Chryseobacterium sp. TaxID=1871047 RepID=UPI0011CAD586|nr:class I SAM-dependent methyltransferase [Chryseobacterium sp.]TXF79020.1 class I SAM-dependent methyltransferase [Chryseobacterium sp.]
MTDLPGLAIHDFYYGKNTAGLFVEDRFGPEVEMPVSLYFRTAEEMPELERIALEECRGRVLDIGAGAGSHALELERKSLDVTALEISPKSCEVMEQRGLRKVLLKDFFQLEDEKFDTLLLLMNGVGISSTLAGFRDFLKKCSSLLNPSGSLIFDSCDIAYMYEDLEFPQNYYGEVECRYHYGTALTDWFKWLYIDQGTMKKTAGEEGWSAEIVYTDEIDQYLAVLKKN